MIRKALLACAFIGGFAVVSTGATGCAVESPADDEMTEGGDEGSELAQSQDEVREVIPGPLARSTNAEVWTVENQWAEKDTRNAKKAGVAWPENSGLSWEEKYQKWVNSFEQVPSQRYGKTIKLTTPEGKTLHGPVLECADVAIWLRMTFSAWYHLPFYMAAWKNGQPIYFGHFGVVDKNGQPFSGFPLFKTSYRNYEGSYQPGEPWPSDSRLRTRHVGSDDGAAGVPVSADGKVLAEGEGAGAYFDELFLNKRAGYLMIWLDGNFGSMSLADGANMFHIQPEATSAGDALVERWQRDGIGHTLPVVNVRHTTTGKLRVQTASGSMPRRQPVWESEAQSANYFKNSNTGGEGNAYDGTPYAKLGGGIRRWRTPVLSGGRWHNSVPQSSRAVYIEDGDLAAISARPAKFKELLAEESPEAARDGAIAIIEAARRELRSRPASCSQRTKREEGFNALYEVMQQRFNKTKAQVDAEYRKLEDYVFSELEYTRSKTCCWNASTAQMADIILDKAQKDLARDQRDGVCRQPTVFKASGGGKYDTWKTHAAELGRAADWREWSEDETCSQRGVEEDSLGAHGNHAMCQ